MEYRNLGTSGLKVSELALGTMQWGWTADEEQSYAIMDAFVEAGGNLIDTADVYSRWIEGNPGGVSEEIIGRWMKARSSRHDVVLATKVKGRMWAGPNGQGLSRIHIVRAAEDSLRRLQTDHIDLYQSHSFDRETPIEESMRAFDDLVRAGKVRYVGCSNYPAWRLVEALWTARSQGLASYVSLQPHYNLLHRQEFEQHLAEVVESYGLGVIAYSPLANGFLSGKYRPGAPLPESARAETVKKRYLREENSHVLDRLAQIGRSHDKTIPQVALAWLLSNPLVTAPIIGANTLEQLRASLGAVGFRLDDAEKASLDALTVWQEA